MRLQKPQLIKPLDDGFTLARDGGQQSGGFDRVVSASAEEVAVAVETSVVENVATDVVVVLVETLLRKKHPAFFLVCCQDGFVLGHDCFEVRAPFLQGFVSQDRVGSEERREWIGRCAVEGGFC